MSQSMPRSGWATVLVAAACGVAGAWLPAQPAAAQEARGPAIHELVEQGRQALLADKYPEASKLFEQAMNQPDFANVDPDLQFFTFLLASFAAEGTDDNLSAHEFLVIATSHPDADGETWLRRARTAAILEKWTDAGESLTTVAKKFPKAFNGEEPQIWLINSVVRELGQNPRLRPQRKDLIDAFFEAGYKSKYGEEPSYLWLLLATDAIERGDDKRAREAAKRITASETLISMLIDKRFDRLVKQEPKLFDVRTAAEREAKLLRDVVKRQPRSLQALLQYANALYPLGRFDEMLALANTAIARVETAPTDKPPFDDIDDNLNWIHNKKATALAALGRWDEAAQVLADWERNDRNREDKVSQAINLGFGYNDLGRPDDALKAVSSVDWSRGISDYGRMQFQFVRFRAFKQQGKDAEVREIVDWIRENQKDSLDTAQSALLESGDVDGAATLLITRLRDANDRADALAEIQTYMTTPRTELKNELEELKQMLLARADVVAAIAEVGRREKFPVYSMHY